MEKINISVVVALMSLAIAVPPCCYAQNTEQDYLSAHNSARANVKVSPLAWSEKLADEALSYLTINVLPQCVLDFQQSIDGINVQVGDVDFTATKAVGKWSAAQVYYNYATNLCSGGPCAAYVQVVSSNSVNVGCFRAQCFNNMGLATVACKYDPPSLWPLVRPY